MMRESPSFRICTVNVNNMMAKKKYHFGSIKGKLLGGEVFKKRERHNIKRENIIEDKNNNK